MNEGTPENPTAGPAGGQPPPPPSPGYYSPGQVAGPPPPAPRRHLWVIPVALGIGCLPWCLLFLGLLIAAFGAGVGSHHSHIALIRVNGVITAGKSEGGVFNGAGAGAEDLVAQLEKARKSKTAKAIVIRINSPGGSAAGSEEVASEIWRVRQAGKPVYVSMADVAASGGYWIASASNQIFADANTLTGSIGVIFETTDLSGLMKKVGVTPQTIISGKFKDIGSPTRPMRPEERALLQSIVYDVYGRFVQTVAKGRHMPFEDVKKIADGRVFTGTQAVSAKLVDKIGGLRETVLAAGTAAGISGEPDVVEYGHKGFLGAFFGSDNDDSTSSAIQRAVGKEMIEGLRRGSMSGLR